MATEVLTKTWCDPCLQTSDYNVRNEATFSDTIRVGEVTKNLDLCSEHYEQIIGELADILARFGSEPQGRTGPTPVHTPRTTNTFTCPVCERPYQYRNSLSAHTLKVHDVSLLELEGGNTASYPCDFPGCDYGPHGGPFVAKGAQGLGAHKRTRHDVVGTSDFASRQRSAHDDDAEPALV